MSIVVVGSSNMDLICYVTHLPMPGQTLQGHQFKQGFGGKGANQAVMAALLGAKVSFIGKIGGDIYGTQMKENFLKHNIATSHLFTAPTSSSGLAAIFVSSSGENCIVIIPGANNLITPQEVKNSESIIKKAKVLLAQLEIPLECSIEALKIAKEGNVITILNAAPAKHLPDEIYQYVDILCVNQTELQTLTEKEISNEKEATEAAKILLKKGVKQILITLGEKGSLLIDPKNEQYVPAQKPSKPVIDTTGAGDCYLGSLAYFLAIGDLIIEAMKKASFIASISVTRHGTQTSYPSINELPYQNPQLKSLL